MKARFGALILLVGLLSLLAFALVPWGRAGAESTERKPNIIFILTDDQDTPSLAAMPRTEALLGGNAGATYENHILTTSICCPSRVTFLTGQYAHNHHVYTNGGPGLPGGYKAFTDPTNALPDWLQAVGYKTALIGKYLNGYTNPVARSQVIPGWDYQFVAVGGEKGYSNYVISSYAPETNCAIAARRLRRVGRGKRLLAARRKARRALKGCHAARHHHLTRYYERPSQYSSRVFTDKALQQIWEMGSDPRPLYMWLPYNTPHGGHTSHDKPHLNPEPDPRDRGAFAKLGLGPYASLPSFDEADVSDKPPYISNRPQFSGVEMTKMERQIRSRWSSLYSLDREVARLISGLEAAGQLENTYIFFTTDNGWLQGQHRVSHGKFLPYEESINFPLLVRGPGVVPGVRSDLVGNIDFVPTVLAISGAEPARTVDGSSLLPSLRGGQAPQRPGLGLSVYQSGPYYEPYIGVRTSRYTYVEYTSGARELYDLRSDPDELDNLAGRPGEGSLEHYLSSLTAELATCSGAAQCSKTPPTTGPWQ